MEPIIVSDAPKLVGTWTPDDKIDAYLDKAEGLLALCTPDDELSDGSWQARPNIIDEMARARNRSPLRDRICVLREPSVKLPSNINPVYDALDLTRLDAAAEQFLVQLKAWGFDVPDTLMGTYEWPPGASAHEPEVVAGLRPDDPSLARKRVRQLFRGMSKSDQRGYVDSILALVKNSQEWEKCAIGGQLLEAVVEIDPNLITVDILDHLSRHKDFSVRSSVGVILFILASMSPGTVPMDIVARLARPASEDWYVFMPALNALKQLALTRPEAVETLVALADSQHRDDREYLASALKELAAIKPAIVPINTVDVLASDADSAVRQIATEVRTLLRDVSAKDRAHPYSPFTPF